MLEITPNPTETWELCSGRDESLSGTNKNQHDTWYFPTKLGCCTLLSTTARSLIVDVVCPRKVPLAYACS